MARQTQTLPLDYAAQALVAHDDMIAVGGPHSINIFLVSGASITTFASFHLGVQITAIAWGESTSPENDDWSIQLAVATADYNIHVLTKSYTGSSNIVSFGGGLSGHHGRINGLAFCGNRGMEGGRYLASCSEDKVLMIWDLQPNLDMPMVDSPGLPDQAFQPTAYPIPFKHALISVCAHPATSKDLLVADVRGSIYLTDWRTDFTDRTTEAWHHPNVLELVEPHSMAESAMGLPGVTPGSLAWSMDNPDRIGAVFNSKFSLWDLSKLSGGKPNSIGPTSSHGGDRFRWCKSQPDLFAISARQSPVAGAVINIYNTNFQANTYDSIQLGQKPHHVRDFDFVSPSDKGKARIAAVVGQSIVFADVV